MTPAARIEAAIEILEALETTARPADRFIRDWFRARRYAGSKDRAAIAQRVFSVYRHRATLSRRMDSTAPRALLIASLLAEGSTEAEIASLFSGEGHAPLRLSEAERRAISMPARGDPPAWVRGEFPEFLEPELRRAFGATLIDEMIAFTARASIDLRVNTLKTSRGDVLARLKDDGFGAQPTPYAPQGIRIPAGPATAALSRHALFLSGSFEFQDEAAQIAVQLCAAHAGMHVLDLAAGAGGKSLGLAAEMANKGEIVASDVRPAALDELRERAARAGATIIKTASPPPNEKFDIVLLDAPCTGSGTWRRQPELKWRLVPERVAALIASQDVLLNEAASRVRIGGRLVYATCSILPSENEDRVATLSPDRFRLVPASEIWATTRAEPAPASAKFFHATPLKTGTDGFFTAIFERTS